MKYVQRRVKTEQIASIAKLWLRFKDRKIVKVRNQQTAGKNNKKVDYGNWAEIELGTYWDVESPGDSFVWLPVFKTWKNSASLFFVFRICQALHEPQTLTSISGRISHFWKKRVIILNDEKFSSTLL